jgi:type 1 glutamine amidotransferase
MVTICLVALILGSERALANGTSSPKSKETLPRLLVLTERGGQHGGFTDAAMQWLMVFAQENGYQITEINDTKSINKEFLSEHKVFIQLDYVPYNWTQEAEAAFEQAIFDGTIGWVGFHHAALLGDFDGQKMWQWFSDYMGGIRFKNYIAQLASGEVVVERKNHPVMRGVNPTFTITNEEWYTFDSSPRKGVEVLARVDEKSYRPASNITMGDHPAVWSNPRVKARNVFFLMGHDAELLDNSDFTTMFSNAITWAAGPANWFPRFRVLIHHNRNVEEAHQQFAEDGIRFFREMTIGDGLVVDVTDNIEDFNDEKLRSYHLVISLNDNPGHTPEQRAAFQRYMERGGAWLGFHSAGYNDSRTQWPWFVDFLGGAIFHRNNWPPQSAKLIIDDTSHPVTKGMPASYISPQNEWYQFQPSPRDRKNVKILVSLSEENYPIGFKDTVTDGDFPVVWSNTDYNMVYMNMGHGKRIFVDPTQNYLIYNALRWLMREQFK